MHRVFALQTETRRKNPISSMKHFLVVGANGGVFLFLLFFYFRIYSQTPPLCDKVMSVHTNH